MIDKRMMKKIQSSCGSKIPGPRRNKKIQSLHGLKILGPKKKKRRENQRDYNGLPQR